MISFALKEIILFMPNVVKGKFAVLKKINSNLALLDLKIPNLKNGQVLVKLHYSFICGSQMNEWLGRKGKDQFIPHTLGHEASGKIIKIGKGVNKFKDGDNVFISWIKNKKMYEEKIQYIYNQDIVNSGPVSTFSKYSIISENRIYKLPSKYPLKNAALFGCAFPTGVGLAKKTIKLLIKKNETICVFGVGGIGLITILTLKYFGYQNIIAIDKNSTNLKYAKFLGASKNLDLNSFKSQIRSKKINKDSIKLNIEASGNKIMMESAYKFLSANGTCLIAGNIKLNQNIKINPYDIIFGKKLLGTIGGDIDIKKNLRLFMKLIKSNNKIKYIFLKKIYKLENINKAFIDFKNGITTRPLIKL